MTKPMLRQLADRVRRCLPSTCIVCGLLANSDHNLCQDCLTALPKLGACCRRCGLELSGRLDGDGCCTRCLISPPSFNACVAAFPYLSPIDKLVADFKFSARFDIGYSLSRVLANLISAHYLGATKPDLLLPVPLHRNRLRERGFNQAREICKVLSKYCGVSTAPSILLKIRNTDPQTSMSSASARKRNLHRAFALNKPDSLKGIAHIALVDDVVTTMATTEAIARMLRAQQDCKIDVWCLARANR